MARALSSAARAAVFSQQTEKVFLTLLTISHPNITTIRLVNDLVNCTSNGNTFVAYPFTGELFDEREDAPPQVQLVIDGVDRSVITALRAAGSPPAIQLEVVLRDTPDVRELGPLNATLRNVRHLPLTVSGQLSFEDVLNEPFPGYYFNPRDFPAAF